MKVTVDNNYGADADGNRGIRMEFYELEKSDREEVKEKILEQLEEYESKDEWPSSLYVEIDGVGFDLEVSDYL